MSSFADRVGLHEDFFDAYKVAHMAVEARIENVTRELSRCADFFRLPNGTGLDIRIDQMGKPKAADIWPLVTVFQLRSSRWTQLFQDIRSGRPLELARHLSERLSTRVLAIEVTDDAYFSHAVMRAGKVDKLMLSAMNVDVKNVLTRLALPVPDEYQGLDPDDWESVEEADYAYPGGHPQPQGRAIDELVRELGCYLHDPSLTDGPEYRLSGLGPEDVTRLDTIYRTADTATG